MLQVPCAYTNQILSTCVGVTRAYTRGNNGLLTLSDLRPAPPPPVAVAVARPNVKDLRYVPAVTGASAGASVGARSLYLRKDVVLSCVPPP